jgi:anti-sigma factor RsiW
MCLRSEHPVTCQDVAEFLMDYLNGDLAQAKRVIFEEHLTECPDCVAYLQTYEMAIKLGKAACNHGDNLIPREVPEELVQAILAARRGGS